jgi:glycine cleavage system H protein
MMAETNNIPNDLRYTKEHEWVKIEKGIGTIGITDYAQHALTDIVFVELPEIGKKAEQSKQLCVVESVKSVSDIFAPVSGEVVGVNNELEGKPENVNNEPYGRGWIVKVKVSSNDELNNLMDAEAYKSYLKGMKH